MICERCYVALVLVPKYYFPLLGIIYVNFSVRLIWAVYKISIRQVDHILFLVPMLVVSGVFLLFHEVIFMIFLILLFSFIFRWVNKGQRQESLECEDYVMPKRTLNWNRNTEDVACSTFVNNIYKHFVGTITGHGMLVFYVDIV